MFNRVQIKENAKSVLKRSYWMGFLVTLLVGIATGGSGGGGGRVNNNFNNQINNINGVSMTDIQSIGQTGGNQMSSEQVQQMMDQIRPYLPMIIAAVALIFVAIMVFGAAWSFFVSGPAQLGQSRFFIATREQTNPVDFSYVLYGFKYNYLKQAWAYFSTKLLLGLYYLLWSVIGTIPAVVGGILAITTEHPAWLALALLSLPCMIPVLIKSIQYKMVPYILANNSGITGKRARELSKAMAEGNKWNLFVLDLSFIGWFILGILLCGIGILFVMPYYNAAYAEAYTCLKAEAMQTKGISGDEELPSMIGAAI